MATVRKLKRGDKIALKCDVLKALKITVFWNVIPYSLVNDGAISSKA
jgi:hypothetical protein